MSKLKLGPIADDKPLKVQVELPAALHQDLVDYAHLLGREQGQSAVDPARLIAPASPNAASACPAATAKACTFG